MIEAKGCKLEYLPPYSPDYNPIEFTFSTIKMALKRCQRLFKGDETPEEMGEMIIRLASQTITPEIARNQYRHAKITL